MASMRYLAFVSLLAATTVAVGLIAAQPPDDKPVVAIAATAKFAPVPNAPQCFTVAVEKGDPTSGPSVILAKFAPGCVAPFHWHTPSETVMITSGLLEVQMQGDKTMIARHGDYVYMPPRHVHRATCTGSAACLVFLISDAAFDIHWVDAAGKEIPLDDAMKAAKAGGASAKKP
jgi:quercetin dioxygenase-like cupin family protein